jgi:type VI secretion system secreted protein Hcp
MAIDSYMYFQDYNNQYLMSESQVKLADDKGGIIKPYLDAQSGPFITTGGASKSDYTSGLFEVEDYSFDIEQILSIGSQRSGAGAGKVTFNAFSITRKIDCASPIFFKMACAGKSFQKVGLGVRKSAGTQASGVMNLAFTFKLVAVKTLGWSHDDEAPKETVTFEYGALVIQYALQKPDGTLLPAIPGGWNRVKNIEDESPDTYIK